MLLENRNVQAQHTDSKAQEKDVSLMGRQCSACFQSTLNMQPCPGLCHLLQTFTLALLELPNPKLVLIVQSF